MDVFIGHQHSDSGFVCCCRLAGGKSEAAVNWWLRSKLNLMKDTLQYLFSTNHWNFRSEDEHCFVKCECLREISVSAMGSNICPCGRSYFVFYRVRKRIGRRDYEAQEEKKRKHEEEWKEIQRIGIEEYFKRLENND